MTADHSVGRGALALRAHQDARMVLMVGAQSLSSRARSCHCEPTGRANARPMTGSAKQSRTVEMKRPDCFVAEFIIGPAEKLRWLLAMPWQESAFLRRDFARIAYQPVAP
jgi:hypothetical protein